jgi:hypothetical protein
MNELSCASANEKIMEGVAANWTGGFPWFLI